MKTIQDFAALLDGREYKKEMTEDEIIQARKLGFVIVFGCSDDRTVFHGAIEEERQTVDGGTLYITEKGLFEDCPCNCIYSQEAKEKASPIEVRWCKGPYVWSYRTEIDPIIIFSDRFIVDTDTALFNISNAVLS